MKVIWSDTAKSTYEALIDFIIAQWNIDVAENLEDRINKLIDLLSKNKFLCPSSKNSKGLRKCVIHPNASLFYKALDDSIVIVAIIDNRMEISF